MSSDDQYFLDQLSAIPNDVKRHSQDVVEFINRHIEWVALNLREGLSTSPWIPESHRPSPPRRAIPLPRSRPTWFERVQAWLYKNKVLTAVVCLTVGGTVVYIYHRQRYYGKKRRARRASNGARKEVVVIGGSSNEPIAKSLSFDLVRRGFIVYTVVNSREEEQTIRNEKCEDIRPLYLDIVDKMSAQMAISDFRRTLESPRQAFPGASPHNLHLAGVIMIPDTSYPSGPVETTMLDAWHDALNVKVLGTIATLQALLPIIGAYKSRILVLTPSIIPSLSPPFHGIESSVIAAIEAFTQSLRGEIGAIGVDVLQLKLGTFDCSAVGGRRQVATLNAPRAEALSWSPVARATYGGNYYASSSVVGMRTGVGALAQRACGSHLRELHVAVFDALTQRRPRRIWRVGQGSVAYDLVGRWMPERVVGWMLGLQRVPREELGEGMEVEWERVEEAGR